MFTYYVIRRTFMGAFFLRFFIFTTRCLIEKAAPTEARAALLFQRSFQHLLRFYSFKKSAGLIFIGVYFVEKRIDNKDVVFTV